MPNLGDITSGSKIGYRGRAKFIRVACPDCGVERWRPLHNEVTRCWKCAANHRERQRKPVTFFGDGKPQVGDTATASTVGKAGRGIHVYAACPDCGLVRWTRMRYKTSPCPSCSAKVYNSRSGEQHPRWRDGVKRSRGYIYVSIPQDDPLAVMAQRRYQDNVVVAEHRLVVARSIGRPLAKDEVVHHVNGIKDDNRLENLRLLHERAHHPMLTLQEAQKRLVSLESRVVVLEAENVLFRVALQEVRDSIPEALQNLRCYNTLGNLLDEQVEGIVHSSSNGGLTQYGSE